MNPDGANAVDQSAHETTWIGASQPREIGENSDGARTAADVVDVDRSSCLLRELAEKEACAMAPSMYLVSGDRRNA